MIQHHVGDDIAVRRQVCGRIECLAHGRQFRRHTGPHVRAWHVEHGHIAEMGSGNLRSRHVPTSPAILDRRAMIDFPTLRVVVLIIRKRQHAHRQHARHAVGLRQQMALQAVGVAANELRLRPARLRYRVEVNALCGVQCRRLDRFCALRPGDGHRVVEINRPRCRLTDVRALQAVLRKHQRLGRGRDVERLQH